jgi:UDP-N-acetylmuramoylalanine--D-glutamate ligase
VALLSPGFTSFGMFLNEFDRGDRFRALVGELK